MSPNYEKQILDLSEWFKPKLAKLPQITLTKREVRDGTDSLKEPHAALIVEAHQEWKTTRYYDLSYNQMCNAFFAAARELDKLTVTD